MSVFRSRLFCAVIVRLLRRGNCSGSLSFFKEFSKQIVVRRAGRPTFPFVCSANTALEKMQSTTPEHATDALPTTLGHQSLLSLTTYYAASPFDFEKLKYLQT